MDKARAPLYEALVDRRSRDEASFHVPGHKFGKHLARGETDYFKGIMDIDYTEIDGLDDLHDPSGVIDEAERLAAACFGADETCFLVGGSTSGNLAMIMAVCGRGELLLVQRNVHKSVLHGLMLAGARAVFLPPEVDGESGIPAGVKIDTIIKALQEYPEAKGVFLTYPNYYGMGGDLRPITEAVHRFQVPLLVDEAHGAHFGFHRALPPSAISCGADAVVQSTHKMLTAMTMGAMLHLQGNRIDRQAVKQMLRMIQTSSPSYPVMASLDLSRRLMDAEGPELIDQALRRLDKFHQELRDRTVFEALKGENDAYDFLDPFKISLYDRTGTLNGFDLQKELSDYGIIPEMAGLRHTLLCSSLGTSEEDLERLIQALTEIGKTYSLENKTAVPGTYVPPALPYLTAVSEPVQMSLYLSHADQMELIPLHAAEGRISAEQVVPYPPGIPVLFAGEKIRGETIRYLQALLEAGARFQGLRREQLTCSILVEKTNGEL